MPGGDGTGPAGLGPMTGRAAGYCAGYPLPGYANGVGGRGLGGWGRGLGGGRGWRNQFYATGLTGWQRAAMGWPAFGGVTPPVAPYAAPFAPAMSAKQQIDALKGQPTMLRQRIIKMKIAVSSGKGGTGKTTVATNLVVTAARAGRSVGYLDCDVEEPNGFLFLKPQIDQTRPVNVSIPTVDADKCGRDAPCDT